MELMNLVNSDIIFLSQMTLLRWLTFLHGSLTAILQSCFFGFISVFWCLLYSQTCSNNHLYKTTNCLRQPMLHPSKKIPIQSLLYETTTCLKPTVTTIFVSQMKNMMHMWKGLVTSRNFCLVSIDELEKQLFNKKLLKQAKKYKRLNIYDIVLFLKR